MASKKKRKKKIEKVFSMDLVYAIINKAQTDGQERSINVPFDSVPIIENIVKDCSLKYKKTKFKEFIRYAFFPSPVPIEDKNFDDIDELPDEINDSKLVYWTVWIDYIAE